MLSFLYNLGIYKWAIVLYNIVYFLVEIYFMEKQSKIKMSIERKIALAMYKDIEIDEVQIFKVFNEPVHQVLFKDIHTGKRIVICDKDLFYKESKGGLKLESLTKIARDYGYISAAKFNEISINIKDAKNHPEMVNATANKLYNEIIVNQAEFDATSSVMHLGYLPKLNVSPNLKVLVNGNEVQLVSRDVEFLNDKEDHTFLETYLYAKSRVWNGENIIQGPHLTEAITKSTGLFAIMKDEVKQIKKDYDLVSKNLTFNIM